MVLMRPPILVAWFPFSNSFLSKLLLLKVDIAIVDTKCSDQNFKIIFPLH